ncbi:MAG TPA: AarF/ABC1/UbiB kinase family protein, partial [Dongiaceae bacterium]|nr:AarF/ABC1/UbiB kinase family protein [Dongiaceae bacterium]
IKATGEEICLKIQYPGVAEAVDSDLGAVETLLRVLKIVPITEEFQQWFTEIREMMHREVDYRHEAEKTRLFRERLLDDPRFIVPKLYPEYCTANVIATAYEPGVNIDSPQTKALSQERRNAICISALDLCWKEVFLWGEMQTDPNFGNYFVRLGNGADVPDRIVLLDFGAVRKFSEHTIGPGRELVKAAYLHDEPMLFRALTALKMVNPATPDSAKRSLSKVCFMAIEPFADVEKFPPPPELLTPKGEYRWGTSNLPSRLSVQAGVSAAGASRHFTVPPRELMFLVRKIMGAYTFMSVLNAEIRGQDVLKPYID